MKLGLLVIFSLCFLAVRCDEDEDDSGFGFSDIPGMIGGFFSGLFSSTETAPYTVTKTNGSFEIRQYPSAKWTCTYLNIEGYDIEENGDDRKMFMKLFRYISGKNKQETEVDMTTPVTVKYMDLENNMKKAEMCFYVPKEHQQNPPEPSDSDVYTEDRPALEALTVRRGGYADDDDWKEMYLELKKHAEENNYSGYDMENFYSAGYDAPFKFWNRRNEIWFTKSM